MANLEHALFRSVPQKDYFNLFRDGEPVGEKVVEILNYEKKDVAAASGVPLNSVRYDNRMPSDLRERLIEWATAINLVGSYFKEPDRTMLWFQVPNPQLGGMSPRDMIRVGRYKKLLKFIQTALEENAR